MMESQKKAAEAANLLATVSESVTDITPGDSAPTEPAEMSSVATPAVEQTHAQATASIEHEDLEEEEEDDDEESSDDESGIAFLTPAADAKKTRGPAKEKASKGNKNNSAAAQAVLSLQRMHWTKEMDALLLHIVPIYDGKDWVSIAKHMGKFIYAICVSVSLCIRVFPIMFPTLFCYHHIYPFFSSPTHLSTSHLLPTAPQAAM